MKENNVEQELNDIVSLLRNALSISNYITFRYRFASEHQWAEEGPHLKKQAYAAWHIAKISIGQRRDDLEQYIKSNKDKFSEDDVHNFIAAIKVIDKEIEESFEQEILKEDDMAMIKTKWKDDEYLLDDEEIEQQEVFEDEDEEYVKQTESSDDDDMLDDEDSYDHYKEDDEY